MPMDSRLRCAAALFTFCTIGCSSGEAETTGPRLDCNYGAGQGAPAQCLQPTQSEDYYVDQSLKYFDTLDTSAPKDSIPTYSERSARWEWPPWLKLTGYGREMLLDTAGVVTGADPSTVPTRDCRFFDVQPFARCYVVFEYEAGLCPIYEEFTFNDAGEMTFIEAWTDAPGMLPMDKASDPWAEGEAVARLSTRVPGLGNATGLIDPAGDLMQAIAAQDADVADFAMRAQDFWGTWFKELAENGDGIYARGCGWKK